MSPLQAAKHVVLEYTNAFDQAQSAQLADVLAAHTHENYHWRGLHPFHEIDGAEAVCTTFWQPLRQSFTSLQRRVDVFLAGDNIVHTQTDGAVGSDIWVCQMGHFMGLFDQPWLDIPSTHRMCFIRFAEFHRVHDGKIAESALFIDLIGVMRQAGQNPLPPQTGSSFIYPGPKTHDGLLFESQPADAGTATLDLINQMIDDLSQANAHALKTNDNKVPPSVLAKSWHNDMIWYGPEGIGATYTIERYQHQHQYPFRYNLSGKTFNGHIARFAEGNYGCFFGWPNLTNTSTGGFLGMTGSGTPADMRVVDVYRRDGDKLAENWVIIDLPHWLAMQGLDVLARMRQLLGIEEVS